MAIGGALVALPLALEQSTSEDASRRTIALTRRSLILGTWALVVFVELYDANGKWLDASVALSVIFPLCLAAARALGARRGRIELGLLRHPFRRDLRPHLAQVLNIWLCCALIGGVLAAGAIHSARIHYGLTGSQFTVLAATCAAGLVVACGACPGPSATRLRGDQRGRRAALGLPPAPTRPDLGVAF